MREAKRVGELLTTETLDIVVFTTGIFAAPKRQETAEGIERDMAVSEAEGRDVRDRVHRRLGGTGGRPRKCSRVLITRTRAGWPSEGPSFPYRKLHLLRMNRARFPPEGD